MYVRLHTENQWSLIALLATAHGSEPGMRISDYAEAICLTSTALVQKSHDLGAPALQESWYHGTYPVPDTN